jgi:heat shock protein HtpX
VLVTLGVATHLLGLDRFLSGEGLAVGNLLAFAALFGFGGALISLAISRWSAKTAVGARVITDPATSTEVWLVNTVADQAQRAGIGMPEVAIFESEEVNAFATGMSRNRGLVAVSTGLLQNMTRDEAQAVLAHEIAHIANGDMVTLALLQGVLNTFVIFIARAVGWFVDRVVLKNDEGPGAAYMVTFVVLEIVLGLLAPLVVMAFSRHREFRADSGGAELAGHGRMIAALKRLKAVQEQSRLPERLAAFGIAGQAPRGWRHLLSTHPSLDERIAALHGRVGAAASGQPAG